ncbi:ADP-ribosylglycohydrolase family protein [Vibrio gigantis]|uniref:ADP-ribosylglycohydrolase family protein n=1 Tax=Vibrio gigantis TaxID=296199 RepID=UPI002FC90A6F
MTETEAFVNRAQGALVGLALGDALGTTLEFIPKHAVNPISDICGGGPFNLEAGQWTDDTSMALCLADSLLECSKHNAKDQVERYLEWRSNGYNAVNGHCFDIGFTISSALNTYLRTGDPESGGTESNSTGNGSIMRLAPIAIFYAQSKGYTEHDVQHYSAQSSLITHREPRCVEACKILGHLLSQAMLGFQTKTSLIENLIEAFIQTKPSEATQTLLNAISIAVDPNTSRDHIFGRGYVVDSLQAAIWCFLQSDSFEQGALLAANIGDDADTTCAVYGQIAGAYYGYDSLPKKWLSKLAWQKKIRDKATELALYQPNPVKQNSRFYFKLKKPEQVLGLEHLELSETKQESLTSECPTLDITKLRSRASLLEHIQTFFRYSFDMPELVINESMHLYDELEKLYYAKIDGVAVSDVSYGKIFCDREGNGGVSDRGLALYFAICEDLPDTLGIDGSNSPFEGYDFTLDNFEMEWQTIGDFINDCLRITEKLQEKL